MARAHLPFYIHATHAAREALGINLERAAIAALRAVLKHGRSLDVACQQVTVAGRCYALSSRVSAAGDLVVELDVGDARLDDRIILEAELRQAERKARDADQANREAERLLRNRQRW